MNISYHCVDQTLGQCERFCNKIDSIPFISSYSGMVRILAGIVQVATGAAFAYLKVVHALLKDSFYTLREAWNGIAYSLHGLGNIARGSIAVFPGINLLLVIYDYRIGRLNYRFEEVPKSIYPLNRNLT